MMPCKLLGLFVLAGLAPASIASAACYDFTHPFETVLEAPAPLTFSKSDRGIPGILEASGTDTQGVSWASVKGRVPLTVAQVMAQMRTQVVRKGGGDDSGMVIMPLADPVYLAHQKIRFSIKPLPFVHVEWIEDWAYSLASGTKEAPERILVGYEKTSGSSHVEHLCGAMVLSRTGKDSSDVTIYEEIKATRRGEEDNLNGIRATLRNLQTLGR